MYKISLIIFLVLPLIRTNKLVINNDNYNLTNYRLIQRLDTYPNSKGMLLLNCTIILDNFPDTPFSYDLVRLREIFKLTSDTTSDLASILVLYHLTQVQACDYFGRPFTNINEWRLKQKQKELEFWKKRLFF